MTEGGKTADYCAIRALKMHLNYLDCFSRWTGARSIANPLAYMIEAINPSAPSVMVKPVKAAACGRWRHVTGAPL